MLPKVGEFSGVYAPNILPVFCHKPKALPRLFCVRGIAISAPASPKILGFVAIPPLAYP